MDGWMDGWMDVGSRTDDALSRDEIDNGRHLYELQNADCRRRRH